MKRIEENYRNNAAQWPSGEWPQGGPPDSRRCQYQFEGGRRCGLPATDTGETPRCLFHAADGQDTPGQRELQEAVDRGAFLAEANLQGMDLSGMDLSGAQIPRADLSGANISRARLQAADLRDTNLQGADLSDASIQDADLTSANLARADLSRAELTDADLRGATLQGANLRETKIEGHTDLRGATLVDARLQGMYLDPQARMGEVTWTSPPGGLIHEDRAAHRARRQGDNRRALKLLLVSERTYRQIKHNYQEAGDYQTAGRFFIREMEAARLQMGLQTQDHPRAGWVQRAVWWVMYHASGYGEWPGRLAITGGLLILFFALLHAYVCGFDDGVVRGVQVGPGIEWDISPKGFLNFASAVYFSVVTFTGLGYGDIHPVNFAGRVVASIEVIIGITTMSLILITIVRRWSR